MQLKYIRAPMISKHPFHEYSSIKAFVIYGITVCPIVAPNVSIPSANFWLLTNVQFITIDELRVLTLVKRPTTIPTRAITVPILRAKEAHDRAIPASAEAIITHAPVSYFVTTIENNIPPAKIK
jgi:hypothetical protein